MPDNHCEECGCLDGVIRQVDIAWPNGQTFTGFLHAECELAFIERFERKQMASDQQASVKRSF